MNETNRGLNRAVIGLVGLVLLAAGAAVVMAQFWPAAADAWHSVTASVEEWLTEAQRLTQMGDGGALNGVTLGAVVLAVIAVVLCIIIMARLGGGRAASVMRLEPGDGPLGAITLEESFAADALAHSLEADDAVVTSKVSTRRIRGVDVLHIQVAPRQNVSPGIIVERVSGLVNNLSTLLGRDLAALVSVRSGIRARLAADQPRVQ